MYITIKKSFFCIIHSLFICVFLTHSSGRVEMIINFIPKVKINFFNVVERQDLSQYLNEFFQDYIPIDQIEPTISFSINIDV